MRRKQNSRSSRARRGRRSVRRGPLPKIPYFVRPTGKSVTSYTPSCIRGNTIFSSIQDISSKSTSVSGFSIGHGFHFELTPLHLLASSPRVENTLDIIRTNVSALTIKNISVKVYSTAPVTITMGEAVLNVAPYRTFRDSSIRSKMMYQHSFSTLKATPGSKSGPYSKPLISSHTFKVTDFCGEARGLQDPIAAIHYAVNSTESSFQPADDAQMYVEFTARFRMHYEYGFNSYRSYYFLKDQSFGFLFQTGKADWWYPAAYSYDADSDGSAKVTLTDPTKLKKITEGKLVDLLSTMEID